MHFDEFLLHSAWALCVNYLSAIRIILKIIIDDFCLMNNSLKYKKKLLKKFIPKNNLFLTTTFFAPFQSYYIFISEWWCPLSCVPMLIQYFFVVLVNHVAKYRIWAIKIANFRDYAVCNACTTSYFIPKPNYKLISWQGGR